MTETVAEQRTIAGSARLCGVGLHSGEEVELELVPAAANTGIVFVRVDLPGEPRVPASVDNLVERPRRTALARGPVEVHTTEHLLAALWAARVDNVEVRINRPELPGMDGSALPFYQAIREAGIRGLGKPAREVRLREPVVVDRGGASVAAAPSSSSGLKVSYSLDFRSTGLPSAERLGAQFLELEVDEEVFMREIAPARTFVLKEEVDALRREGLGKGANTQNTVVFGENGVVDGELRFPDECVRHKLLDLLGDLCLMGRRLHGRVIATRSGHALNVQLAKRILRETAREGEVQDILSEADGGLDSRQIERLLPHRYPFLLVDRILSLGDRRAVGLKNVTRNEEFFEGHFPGHPLMPGVLQVEAMAQLAGILLLRKPENVRKLALLMSLDRVKFRHPVVPGDQLILEAELKRQRQNTAQVETRALVGNVVACEARMRYMLVEP